MRKEVDLLGSKEISSDCYYGIHTQRAIDNFKISSQTINDMPEIIRGMALTKKAVALANQTLRILDPKTADAIVKACDLILNDHSLDIEDYHISVMNPDCKITIKF